MTDIGDQLRAGCEEAISNRSKGQREMADHKRRLQIAKRRAETPWQREFCASLEKRLAAGFALTGKQAATLLGMTEETTIDPDVPTYGPDGLPTNEAGRKAMYNYGPQPKTILDDPEED